MFPQRRLSRSLTVAAAADMLKATYHQMEGNQQPDGHREKVPGLMLLLYQTTREQTQRVTY